MQPSLLLADPLKLTREALSQALEAKNFKVVAEASSGTELIQFVKKIPVNIVVMDITVSKAGKQLVFDTLQKLHPLTKTVVLTPYEHLQLQSHFFCKGVSALVHKNICVDELAKLLHTLHKPTPVMMRETQPKFRDQLVFTAREVELIALLCEGHTNKEIALVLNVCEKTIEAQKRVLFKKTKTINTHQCMAYLLGKGYQYLR